MHRQVQGGKKRSMAKRLSTDSAPPPFFFFCITLPPHRPRISREQVRVLQDSHQRYCCRVLQGCCCHLQVSNNNNNLNRCNHYTNQHHHPHDRTFTHISQALIRSRFLLQDQSLFWSHWRHRRRRSRRCHPGCFPLVRVHASIDQGQSAPPRTPSPDFQLEWSL